MCDPASAIAGASAIASMAGSAMSASAQNDQAGAVIRAREATLRNSIARQQALQQEAVAAYQPVLDSAGSDASDRATATQERVATYDAARAPAALAAPPTAVTGGGTPQVVTSEIGRRMKQASASASADARRRGLGSAGACRITAWCGTR